MMMKRAAYLLPRFLATFVVSVFGTAFANEAVRIIDDGDAGFSLSSPSLWLKTANLGFKADYLSTFGVVGGVATWSFSVPPAPYRVSITWHNSGSPYNIYYSPAAPVSVAAGGTTLLTTT